MNAGLPGTGIGGLLYLVLALLMPLRELYLTARGRGSRERWRLALRQAAMAAAILGMLAAAGWAVARVGGTPGGSPLGGTGVLVAPAVAAAGVLVVVVLALRLWALVAGEPRAA